MKRTKLFLVWLNLRLTFKYYHRETEIEKQLDFLHKTCKAKQAWKGCLTATVCASYVHPGGGVFLGIHGGGVPSGFPNPDPISDQKMSFFTPVFRTRPLKSIPVFKPVLWEIMSSLLRSESQHCEKISYDPFQICILFFPSYSLGVEMTFTPVVLPKTITDSRPKYIYIPDCKTSLASFVLYFHLLLIRFFIKIWSFLFVSSSLLQKLNIFRPNAASKRYPLGWYKPMWLI